MDTGASEHYFTPTAPLLNINHAAPKTKIRTATGELSTSSAAAQLAITGIPTQARAVHVMPTFTNNLLSLGKLCDADCTAYLDKHHLAVHNKHGDKILHGDRERDGARLWRVNIAPADTTTAPAPSPAPTIVPPAHNPTPTPTTVPPNTEIVRPRTATKQYRYLDLPNTPALIAYLHAVAGYPVKTTWLAAIKRGAYAS